jgi:hypothetical protein
MITIANFIANIFILGLGVLFLGIGTIIILGVLFSFKDMINDRN